MFFHVSHSHQDNFPHNFQVDNFVVSMDNGWTRYADGVWFKGYLDSGLLLDHIDDICQELEPSRTGNFCVINCTEDGVRIHSDRLRSFPLFYSPTLGLSNLHKFDETIWTDCLVRLNPDLSLSREYFDPIGSIDTSPLTLEQVVEQVDLILDRKAQTFLSQLSDPIRVYLSGGMDTALLFSYIQKHAEYKLVLNNHVDYDYFYLKNHGKIGQFWGYHQIHHWNEPCVLASGAPGDEFTLRSPVTSNMLLLHYGTSIPKLLEENTNCLHYTYFNQQKYLDAWHKQQDEYTHVGLADTIKVCANYNVNDWQHWHFGNTITWTPLRDIEIFKLVARLQPNDLIKQIMDSALHKQLIAKNNPDILGYLSEQKNSTTYLENLTALTPLDNSQLDMRSWRDLFL
jgi:hypothetical protein